MQQTQSRIENPENKNAALFKLMSWSSDKLSSGNKLPLTLSGLQKLQTPTYPYMKVAMLEHHIGYRLLAAHLSE